MNCQYCFYAYHYGFLNYIIIIELELSQKHEHCSYKFQGPLTPRTEMRPLRLKGPLRYTHTCTNRLLL